VLVRVNGQERELLEGATVADLVCALELAREVVAVQVDGVLVRRAEHALRVLCAGEEVEIVTLVGGG
jgi:sulfur carrier protein